MTARLVLMPGLDGTGRLTDWVLPHLPVAPEPVVMRYPSEDPLGYADLEDLVISRVGSSGPLVLVAESFSGPLAVRVAARPELEVVGLVFAASFVANPFRVLRPWTSPMLPRWLFGVQGRAFVRFMLTGKSAPLEVVDGLREAAGMVAPEVMQHRGREVLNADQWERFAALDVPMLYLRGLQDRIIPAGHADQMQQRSKRLRVEDLDAPHMVLQCAPADSGARISAFVSDLSA